MTATAEIKELIKTMNVMELAELVKDLEQEFGGFGQPGGLNDNAGRTGNGALCEVQQRDR